MNVTEAVARRRSVRAFKPDPVPGALVRDILEKAARAPSGGNLQPWRVYGLAGEPLAVFNAKIAALLQQGVPSEPVEYGLSPRSVGAVPQPALSGRRGPLRHH